MMGLIEGLGVVHVLVALCALLLLLGAMLLVVILAQAFWYSRKQTLAAEKMADRIMAQADFRLFKSLSDRQDDAQEYLRGKEKGGQNRTTGMMPQGLRRSMVEAGYDPTSLKEQQRWANDTARFHGDQQFLGRLKGLGTNLEDFLQKGKLPDDEPEFVKALNLPDDEPAAEEEE